MDEEASEALSKTPREVGEALHETRTVDDAMNNFLWIPSGNMEILDWWIGKTIHRKMVIPAFAQG